MLLLLTVFFFLGPLCLSNLWGYIQTKKYLTDAAFRNIRNVASLEATKTLRFVQRSKAFLITGVVGDVQFQAHLTEIFRVKGSPLQATAAAVLRDSLVHEIQEGGALRALELVSAQGTPIASVGSIQHNSLYPASRCVPNVKGGVQVLGFEYSQPTDGEDEPYIVLTSPVYDQQGRNRGTVCARFAFDVHKTLIIAHKERTRGASLYLLDERGRIACSSFGRDHHAAYGEPLRTYSHFNPRNARGWKGRHRDEAGIDVLAAYAPVPELGWGIVVEVPVKQALAELELLKWQAFSASGLLVVFLLILTFLGWRMIVRPLRALSAASERIASGAPGETVTLQGPREAMDLASAFNRMSLALKKSQDSLEEKISARTRELRESQEFSELLLNTIDQRVIVMDRNYEILKANAAAHRMHGGDLLGKPAYEVFEGVKDIPLDWPAAKTFAENVPATGERSQRTVRGLEAVYVETYPLLDPMGRVEAVIETGRVVTAEKRLQMQIIHQEKMAAFGQLAAGVAHDLGNPLAAIDSQLQLAKQSPGHVEDTIDVVRKQVGRMDRMLRELMGLTRPRRGVVGLVSINQVIEDVARLLTHDPRARATSIQKKLGVNLPGVRMNEEHVMQVLLNLGINALDAMPQGGILEFSTEAHGEELSIRVTDTGTGIEDTRRSRLFEPYFTTKDPGKGTGLGLFVSRGMVEAVGGKLELERTGSEGTTFLVRLVCESVEVRGNDRG